jgi:hypothetical protein
LILDEFPVELTILNSNFGTLFSCPNAKTVTLKNFIIEFYGRIAFRDNLRMLIVVGMTLTSNLIRIFQECRNLELLAFSSLRQVLDVENNETIHLPMVTQIEIKVRSDQETFTSDENIIINILKAVEFGSLQSILISVRSPLEWYEDEDESDSQISEPRTSYPSRDTTIRFDLSDESTGPTSLQLHPSQASPSDTVRHRSVDASTSGSSLIRTDDTAATILAPHRLPSAISSISERPPDEERSRSVGVGMDSETISENEVSTGLSQYDFIARYLNGRTQQLQGESTRSGLQAVLSDSSIRRGQGLHGTDLTYNMDVSLVESTQFFELVRKNGATIKTLIVKAKPEFMCFGNLSSHLSDLQSIQFRNIEYSFGRSQLCFEQNLLQAQSQLVEIKVQIFDDLWRSLMSAVDKSHSTLKEMDLKVLSLDEEAIDLSPISRCSNLTILKLFHFYEKTAVDNLPVSLTRVVLNGPITGEEIRTLASRLESLEEFTLIANHSGGRIDKNVFLKLVSMPKIAKLVFIQCLVDVDDISEYCSANAAHLDAKIIGPKEVVQTNPFSSAIQFVVVLVKASFPREAKR